MTRVLSARYIVLCAALIGATLSMTAAASEPAGLRAPTPSDDASRGYQIGDLWRSPDGRLFVARRLMPGSAEWGVLPSRQAPLDAVPPAAAAYGVLRLTAADQADRAFDVTRASDGAVKTIGFVGGVADVAAADRFCAATACSVTTWYDQSGNHNDARQPRPENAPSWLPNGAVGTMRAISFNSIKAGGLGLPVGPRFLATNGGPTWRPAAATWFIVGQHIVSKETRAVVIDQGKQFGVLSGFTGLPPGITLRGLGMQAATPVEIGPSVLMLSWQDGTVTGISNNAVSHRSFDKDQPERSGIVVGSTESDSPANFDGLALILYTRPLSPGEVLAMRAALHSAFAITPQADDVVVADGDSTSVAIASTQNNTTTRIALTQLDRPVQAYNIAIAGMTMVHLSTSGPADLRRLYRPAARRFVVHILCGANDIRGGTAATVAFAALQRYVSTAKALGPNVRVIVGTEMVQTDILRDPVRLAALRDYNERIRSDWSKAQSAGGLGADGLADYWADPAIGPGSYSASAFSDPACSPDGGHPTDHCMQAFARIEAAALRAALH